MGSSFHENLAREERLDGPTDRAFGYTVGGIAAAIGTILLVFGRPGGGWVLGAGALLVLAAALRPSVLRMLNRMWMRLGLVLFTVVNPLVMGVLYYLCIVPMGLAMRLFRKDPLKLTRDPRAPTYWIARPPRSPHSRGMKDQF